MRVLLLLLLSPQLLLPLFFRPMCHWHLLLQLPLNQSRTLGFLALRGKMTRLLL